MVTPVVVLGLIVQQGKVASRAAVLRTVMERGGQE